MIILYDNEYIIIYISISNNVNNLNNVLLFLLYNNFIYIIFNFFELCSFKIMDMKILLHMKLKINIYIRNIYFLKTELMCNHETINIEIK